MVTHKQLFISFAKENKIRVTPERLAVLQAAIELENFSNRKLIEKCENFKPLRVSKRTVYNTVSLLVRAGVLKQNNYTIAEID